MPVKMSMPLRQKGLYNLMQESVERIPGGVKFSVSVNDRSKYKWGLLWLESCQ